MGDGGNGTAAAALTAGSTFRAVDFSNFPFLASTFATGLASAEGGFALVPHVDLLLTEAVARFALSSFAALALASPERVGWVSDVFVVRLGMNPGSALGAT